LAQLGWSRGRNVRIDYRYAPAGSQVQALAKEVVAAQPDVIFVYSTPSSNALQRETSTIPIVFLGVSDPIGSGLIASLARPGGNITGLSMQHTDLAGKRLELVREVVTKHLDAYVSRILVAYMAAFLAKS
jgi:putative ABC transport system substrate-binding protein